MERPRPLVLGIAAVVLAGASVVAIDQFREETFVPAPNTAATTITVAELAAAAEVSLFFGHQSVGRNILDGVAEVFSANGVPAPAIVELTGGEPAGTGPGIRHVAIGRNGDPLGKIAAFDAAIRSGNTGDAKVALLKLCYVDIRWNTDVDALFAQYRTTLDALERDYPGITFLHATAPLTTGPAKLKDHVKVLIGRDDNAARERYSALVRQAYGGERLLDIAAIEATGPDGTTSNLLQRGYTSDGAHLNATGGSLVAVGLLRLLSGQRTV